MTREENVALATHHVDALSGYVRKISRHPLLSQEEEFELAKEWHQKGDENARQKILDSHQHLILKIARGYRGYGLPLSDLIAEGNLGMMQAIKKFDPDKGFRFSTYAMWWIKAAMKDHIMRNWSLVRIGTTAGQKKLFFNLKSMLAKHKQEDHEEELEKSLTEVAKKLNISEDEVRSMSVRLMGQDSSLNTKAGAEGEDEWIDWIQDDHSHEDKIAHEQQLRKQKQYLEEALSCLNQRQHKILLYRRLCEPPKTLEECSQEMNLSRERVRQIEVEAFHKLQKEMRRVAPEDQFLRAH